LRGGHKFTINPVPNPLIDLTFHHIGVACNSISEESESWASLGYVQENEPFVDDTQGIRGVFMIGGGPRMELLEGVGGSSTLAPWIKRGVKLYHTGYLTADFDSAIKSFVARGAVITGAPAQSVYFGARIAFLMQANMLLVELIESQRTDATRSRTK
jgi:methylmalonyl-CoA/ethylmalonyl-CoA epimerase